MNDAAGVVLIVFFVVIALIWTFARFGKAESILDEWARANGYHLLECRRKDLFRGPYFFTTSKTQLVYRIVVSDAAGNRRSGYARVGGFMTGLLSEKVSVRWDDEN